MWTLEACQQADAQDPLAQYRELFALPLNTVYLDGNSLGAQPKAALSHSQQLIEHQWGQQLIRSWNDAGWFELPLRLGNQLGQLLGAQPDELVLTDSTSINLYKALSSALNVQKIDHPDRRIILAERDSFPTDLYMIQGLIEQLGQGYQLQLIDANQTLPQALNNHVAVLLLSHVNYRSGALHDMARINAQAQAHGILTVWDLAHSAGALPIHLNQARADYAVGCTYKYLNGGPGSPAYIWVAERHHNRVTQPLTGWWSHAHPFKMEPQYQPAHGIRQYLCGTQPILSLATAQHGLDIATLANIEHIRTKALALGDLLIERVQALCSQHPIELITPTAHTERGSHISFTHPDGYPVIQALIAHGIIGDYREPHVMRFGLTPLYLRYTDLWHTAETLAHILEHKIWQQPQYQQRATVT